jgi:excinuclease UvrABC ATPase subunit
MCTSSISTSSEFDDLLQFVSQLTDLSSRLYSSYHLEDLGVDCYQLGVFVSCLAQKVLEHAQVVMQSNWQQSIKSKSDVNQVQVVEAVAVNQVDVVKPVLKRLPKNIVKAAIPHRFKGRKVLAQGQDWFLKDVFFSDCFAGSVDTLSACVYVHRVH